jgi:hypothetical protein
MTTSPPDITVLEGIPMKTNRLLLVITFMSMFLFGASLYGQQEVDPTWYNPWPASSQATAPSSQAQVAKHKNQAKSQAKNVSGARTRQTGMLRAKRLVSRRTQS